MSIGQQFIKWCSSLYAGGLLLLPITYGCTGVNHGRLAKAIEAKIIAQWPQHCESLKTQWVKQSSFQLEAQPIPPYSSQQAYWPLRLAKKVVPLPPIEYQDVKVTHNAAPKETAVFLKGSDQTIIIIQSGQNAFVPLSGWETSLISPTHDPKLVLQWSEDNLPTPPTTFEGLYAMSLDHHPADLNCSKDSIQQDMVIANALYAKSLFPGGLLESAYKLSDGSLSWMTLSKVDARYEWKAALYNGKQPDQYVTMRVPQKYKELGQLIGQDSMPIAPEPPAWLEVLQKAMNQSDIQLWRDLAESLEDAGIDNSSVEKIVESLDQS